VTQQPNRGECRVPDFLVIGAQKCGTTTLYEDLRSHPDIGIADKESSVLAGDDSLERDSVSVRDALLRRYRVELPHRPPGGVLGEVATSYAMLPMHSDVVDNAAMLVPGAKIIYIVREPLSRVISHHHHDFGLGLVGPDINLAVHHHAPLLDNTRYATQIKPWLDAFGRDSVLVLRFEDYIADRQAGANTVFEFLGLSPFSLPHPDDVHNAADAKHVAVGRAGRLAQTKLYRSTLRKLAPESLRRAVATRLLPKAPPRPAPPRPETVAFILDQLWPEVDQLASLLKTDPWWQPTEVDAPSAVRGDHLGESDVGR
jgi:hypothetical protein